MQMQCATLLLILPHLNKQREESVPVSALRTLLPPLAVSPSHMRLSPLRSPPDEPARRHKLHRFQSCDRSQTEHGCSNQRQTLATSLYSLDPSPTHAVVGCIVSGAAAGRITQPLDSRPHCSWHSMQAPGHAKGCMCCSGRVSHHGECDS